MPVLLYMTSVRIACKSLFLAAVQQELIAAKFGSFPMILAEIFYTASMATVDATMCGESAEHYH